MKHPECNAGCVFENLLSKHVVDEITAVSLILKAVGTEAVSLIDLVQQKIEEGAEVEESAPKPKEKKTAKKLQEEE